MFWICVSRPKNEFWARVLEHQRRCHPGFSNTTLCTLCTRSRPFKFSGFWTLAHLKCGNAYGQLVWIDLHSTISTDQLLTTTLSFPTQVILILVYNVMNALRIVVLSPEKINWSAVDATDKLTRPPQDSQDNSVASVIETTWEQQHHGM